MLFSEYYKLGLSQYELDFVDIPIEEDIAVFIDPFSIHLLSSHRAISCHNKIVNFFSDVINLIKKGRRNEVLRMLNHLHEYKDTHLGFSGKYGDGKGLGTFEGISLYESLKGSKAIETGILRDLEDCILFIDGINKDKISDIATNIIIDKLVEYTEMQCKLFGIETKNVIYGTYRNDIEKSWVVGRGNLPVIKNRRYVLVPKSIVRRNSILDKNQYYEVEILNQICDEHYNARDSLCRTLKRGIIKPPYKKSVREDLKSKNLQINDLIIEYTSKYPKILENYKSNKLINPKNFPIDTIKSDKYDVNKKIEELKNIKPGPKSASKYHRFITGVLTYIFEGQLVNPQIEQEVHEGRKRIDIVFSNIEIEGSFFRNLAMIKKIPSSYIMIECKNYSKDIANPELDQMAGRFSVNRGQFGIITCRGFDDKELFYKRCKDTASDGRGMIILFDDEDICKLLKLKERNDLKGIYKFLDNCYKKIVF